MTWVSIEDARAYAQWAGKRLPHEWEWQYAAQGSDGRRLSVGQRLERSGRAGAESRRARCRAPADVDAHPQGASPFGVMDLVGNVWQWTDEYHDEHTRAAVAARRQLLSAADLALVLPAGLSARSARQISADGAVQGPLRRHRLSLCRRRA